MNKKVKEFLDNSSNYEVIEYIGNLQQENEQLKEDNYEHVNYTNKLQGELNEENLQCSKYVIEINDLQEKYDKQVDNWNKLKEYMSDENISNLFERGYQANDFIEEIRDITQEIEGSDSNVKD